MINCLTVDFPLFILTINWPIIENDHLLCKRIIYSKHSLHTTHTHAQTLTYTHHHHTLTHMNGCIIDFLLWSRSSQLVRFTLIMLDRLSQLAVDDIFYNAQSAHTVDTSKIYSVMFTVILVMASLKCYLTELHVGLRSKQLLQIFRFS